MQESYLICQEPTVTLGPVPSEQQRPLVVGRTTGGRKHRLADSSKILRISKVTKKNPPSHPRRLVLSGSSTDGDTKDQKD